MVRSRFWISNYLDLRSSSIDTFRKGTYLVLIRTISSKYIIFNKFDKDIKLHRIMIYLAKGPRLDINNGPGDDSNSAHILAPAFFNSNRNNGPSPGHSKIRSDGRYTSSSLPFMVWWVPYLNQRLRPEFNNGPEMT